MTATDFCTWINSSLLPKVAEHHPSAPTKISVRTASRWLHSLGFEKVSSKKGIYIDGHERPAVFDYRKLYLRYCHPRMHCHLHVVMNLLLSLLHLKNWSLFSMMRVRFTPMMTRVGCGVRKTKLLPNLKAKDGD